MPVLRRRFMEGAEAVKDLAELAGSAHASGCINLHAQVCALPWLAPEPASLVALSRPFAGDTWTAIRHDPGAVLLLLRAAPVDDISGLCRSSKVLDLALRYHQQPVSCDWQHPLQVQIRAFAIRTAAIAAALARQLSRADQDRAWCCGLLAPLGWMVAAALAASATRACLADPDLERTPHETQRRWLGLDQAGIARRLSVRWQLPGWLALGQLDLPVTVAVDCGADGDLFHLTRCALHLSQRHSSLQLVDPTSSAASFTALGIDPDCVNEQSTDVEVLADAPSRQDLLGALLSSAAELRRTQERHAPPTLERDVDVLHEAFARQIRAESAQLQARKLEALAEFAAGAGHEINNPLAVILGQAQYLLGHKEDWFAAGAEENAKNALQKIVAQTRRVHGLLRDLMQFARPAPPVAVWFDLPSLLGNVAAGLADLASQRQVRIEIVALPDHLPIHADETQVRVALSALLRNAIEAAPNDGWARLTLNNVASTTMIEVAVEDSGPGPDADQRTQLFDPFFSGRAAGRGRGLGLPTAWRLAQQQGGDVHLASSVGTFPTRFVLTLPRSAHSPSTILERAEDTKNRAGSNGCQPASAICSIAG